MGGRGREIGNGGRRCLTIREILRLGFQGKRGQKPIPRNCPTATTAKAVVLRPGEGGEWGSVADMRYRSAHAGLGPRARAWGAGRGLKIHFSSDKEKARQESRAGWSGGPAGRAHSGKKRIDIYRKYNCWCQTPGFIVRGKTNPATETHPQLRIYMEGNDFPIKPVLLDINI